MAQGKRQAGVLTKEAFESAFDVLLEYEPDTGITLPELLAGIFKAAGFELPDTVSLEKRRSRCGTFTWRALMLCRALESCLQPTQKQWKSGVSGLK